MHDELINQQIRDLSSRIDKLSARIRELELARETAQFYRNVVILVIVLVIWNIFIQWLVSKA